MKNLQRIGYLALTASILPGCSTQVKTEKEEKQPNIVFIMTDDHSYQTISAYGHALSQLAPTPNIDRIAKQGILFEQAFVENSLSTPSRACLMTGLYSHQNGQRTLGAGIDTTQTFFSELLQQNNYQTAVVGKWHMQCEPKGFDYYSVLNDQGEYYNPYFKDKGSNGEFKQEKGYATHLITNKSIDFIKNRDKDKPFCLLVHHKAPHRNWQPEPKYLNIYEDIEFPIPDTFYDDYETRCEPAHIQDMTINKTMTYVYDLKIYELADVKPYSEEWNVEGYKKEVTDQMTPEEIEVWNNAYHPKNQEFLKNKDSMTKDEILRWKYQRYLRDYLRCIKSIDDEVGRILDYLEKENLTENTIIVYTSDQGFYMGEHGWFDKRFMYEESMRTPLLIAYPKKIKAQTRTKALVQNIDYAPTFLSLAGIEKPKEMSGTTLEPLFGGEKPENWRADLYYHYYDYPAIHQVRRHDGVRSDRFKLIHFYEQDSKGNYILNCNEFYDLEKDPKELNNLYNSKEYQEQVAYLQERLNTYRTQLKVDEY